MGVSKKEELAARSGEAKVKITRDAIAELEIACRDASGQAEYTAQIKVPSILVGHIVAAARDHFTGCAVSRAGDYVVVSWGPYRPHPGSGS